MIRASYSIEEGEAFGTNHGIAGFMVLGQFGKQEHAMNYLRERNQSDINTEPCAVAPDVRVNVANDGNVL